MGRYTRKTNRKHGVPTRSVDVPVWGSSTIAQMDQRFGVVKAMQHDLSILYSDLGGLSNISVMEQILCDKIVQLKRLTEKKEALMLADQPIDEVAYVNAVMGLSNLLMKIGLKRRARKVQSLSEVLKRQPEPHPAPSPAPQPEPQKEGSDNGH